MSKKSAQQQPAGIDGSDDLAFRLGRFDPGSPYRRVPLGAIGTAASRELARRAAVESLVLVRNPPAAAGGRPALPVDASAVRGLAVVGPSGELLCDNATSCYRGNSPGLGPYGGGGRIL